MRLVFRAGFITAVPESGVARMNNQSIQPDNEKLVDISTVKIDPQLPYGERVASYLNQIGNPYRYLDHGFTVTCSFAGESSLEDCMTRYLREKYGLQKT